MRRILFVLIALMLGGLSFASQTPFDAQSSTQSRPGDPPIASLITVSPPDIRGIVTITGVAGAVFPGAQVAIRNLYTEQVIYTNANVTGTFSATLFATGSTPFWISAAVAIPPELRNLPGSLPGGPGTIIYSTTAENQTGTVTQLIMDGDLADWQAYPQAAAPAGGSFSLRNPTSIYVAVDNPLLANPYDRLRLAFALDTDLYNITIRPDQLRVATIRQSVPVIREREIAVNLGVATTTVELRLPLELAAREPQIVRLTGIQLLDAENATLADIPLDMVVPLVLESDGAVYPEGRMAEESTNFYVAGALAQGASYWTASGRITSLNPSPGDTLTLDLDVTLLTPNLPLATIDLTMLGDLSLQPVSVAAFHTNNGWSNLLTRSGLAIDNVRGDVSLVQTSADWTHITRLTDRLVFGLRFNVTIPANLPPGIYVPVFKGAVQTAEGVVTPWVANGLFGEGAGISRLPLTRLPLTLNVGEQADNRLYWVLFHDQPSNGSRGILADEDTGKAALSNRVKFNSPTYILPPGAYPVEPYLPDFLPNAYDLSATPLVPLLFPGGRLSFEITR
ncbi:MAG: hypothetical protein H7X77_02125, partial [Anaerolineae bacterium]|nr:hypothetical protein [Anaerolineae bacterium]